MISCSEYDYIEIVCLYRYPVTLKLKSGESVQGTAADTVRNDQKEECIKLLVNGAGQLVVLDQVAELTVNTENPHFQQVTFSE